MVEHRKVFFKRIEAQAALQRGSVVVVPDNARVAAWRQDYERMREGMFFEDPPPFERLLSVVGDFAQRFNGELAV